MREVRSGAACSICEAGGREKLYAICRQRARHGWVISGGGRKEKAWRGETLTFHFLHTTALHACLSCLLPTYYLLEAATSWPCVWPAVILLPHTSLRPLYFHIEKLSFIIF